MTAWNAAIANVSGVRAEDAIGQACNEVMGALTSAGPSRCGAACAVLRAAVAGWTTPPARLRLDLNGERRACTLHTLTLPRSPGSILHLLHVGDLEPVAPSHAADAALTRRQNEVLQLLAEGVSVRTIAERLILSESTVRNHVRAILRALDAHSMLQAVSEARRRHLI